MPYTPARGDQVALPLDTLYSPPRGDQVALALRDAEVIEGGFVNALANAPSLQWSVPSSLHLHSRVAFNQSALVHSDLRVNSDEPEEIAADSAIAWDLLLSKFKAVTSRAQPGNPLHKHAAIPWSYYPVLNRPVSSRRREVFQRAHSSLINWRDSAGAELAISAMPATTSAQHHTRCLRAAGVQSEDVTTCVPWLQSNGTIPTIYKPPGVFVPPSQPPTPDPIYTPPRGDQVGLNLFCRYRGIRRGDQVALRLSRIPCLLEAVSVINSLTLQRVSDDAEILCYGVDVSLDIDSWAWQWSATVPYSELAKVSGAGPVEVRANINEVQWLLFVESIRETSSFGERQLSISGRSVSAELAAPWALKASRDEQSPLSAIQLAQQELVDTGWTLATHAGWSDWAVPAGAFSYADLAPIDAIALIATASGAVLVPSPGSRTITMTPRFPVLPWAQASAQADVEIGFVQSFDMDYSMATRYQGIYVAGESIGGQLIKYTRLGSDGSPWLNTITDPLITAPVAGLQRARAEIGATGKRTIMSITSFLLTGPGDPGLVMPGQLVGVLESEVISYNAQCVGVRVQASWDNNGLAVRQVIALDRYTDE